MMVETINEPNGTAEPMVILDLLQHAWAASRSCARDKDHVKLFFKGPAFFLRPEMQGMVSRGMTIHRVASRFFLR